MATETTMSTEQRERARQARNAYLRSWRRKNPEKVKAQQERYWSRKADAEQGDQQDQTDE